MNKSKAQIISEHHASIGSVGGKSTSPAKQAAARKNARKARRTKKLLKRLLVELKPL